MACNQDARPFVDLQKDAEEFKAKFEEDIEKCKSILDAKITALICDPDSLGNSVGPKQNALVEFSKAKYDIYISMKSLMNDMEREWLKYISEMKKLFIDNVEVFLGNTKLEVKLPSGYQPLPGPKKSPSFKKPSAVTSSIYPIISTLTKSIPVFSQKNKSQDFEMLPDEAEMDLNTSRSSSRSRKSTKLDNSSVDLNKSWSFSRQKGKFSERIDLENSLVSSVENGISDDEDTDEENPCQKNQSPGQNFKRNSLQAPFSSNNRSENNTEMNRPEQCIPQQLSPRHGRKSVFTAQNINGMSTKHAFISESQEETTELKSGLPHASSGKSVRSSARSRNAAITKKHGTAPDDSEVINQTETSNNSVALKGRRGRQAPKSKVNAKTLERDENIKEVVREELVITKKSNTTSDESEDINQAETNNSSVSVKGRRGRQAPKSKANTKNTSTEITGRSTRRKTVNERVMEKEPSVSSITINFSAQHDNDDILVAGPSKSVARRKTLLPNVEEDLTGPDIIPGYRMTARSKRKTISGVTDLASVAPSKRLKSSNTQKNYSSVEDEGTAADNLLETNDGYSEWITLKSLDGKIPTSPAIYEVKVWRAKKTAYIGFCESLRQKLTLHKLRQNSGHKHLDKFIERNYNDIQIRYEVVSSVEEAKSEVKNRVNSFVAQHKTTPAYN